MARYLVRSRHGTTWYVRVRVPPSLRKLLGCTEIRRSLGTANRKVGALRASALALQLTEVFAMKPKDPKDPSFSLTIASIVHDLETKKLTLEGIHIDPEHRAEDVAALVALKEGLVGAPVVAPPTGRQKPFAECVAAYMAVRPTIREKTKDEYVSILRDYGDWCQTEKQDPFIQPSAVAYIEQVLLKHTPPHSITTINKHIRRLSSLFIWCVDRGWAAKNIFHKLALPKPKKRVADEREAYTHAEVATLLANLTPAIDERHWVVLLGLYVGARGNELASLYLKDIREIGGIPCFHFIEDIPDKQGGKTVNGERVVPMPNRLLELGFLDQVDKLRREGKARLFECWKWHNKNGYWQYAGKWFRGWRRKLRIEKDFHSLRHTFETGIRDTGVSETLAAELVGHAKGETQSFSRYAKPGHLANLREAINKLPVNPGRTA